MFLAGMAVAVLGDVMGRTKGHYKEEFPKGSKVKIADRAFLEDFLRSWKFHHKLESNQLKFADKIARVKSVGFYHGGDELYDLKGVPGIWHEECLSVVKRTGFFHRFFGD